MSHFHFSYHDTINKVPYSILIMLSASVPKFERKKPEEEEETNAGGSESNEVMDIFSKIAKQSKNG